MEVSMATVLAMGALTPFASPVLLSRLLERPEAAREEGGARGGGGGGGAKAHLSRRDSSGGARGRQDGGFVGRVVVLFMVFACCVAFVCVMLRDFAPEKGSCQEWVGSILAYIGVFAGSAMVCFVAAPNLLNFVTRGIHGGGEGRNH
ncbi:uncharacterized protein LOC127783260 [Oryza glaberrima]|uniref:uncharacterized protein LOC127783260 n=1 Tax=Oryza glaberrima TaxID=4538 RepID=UPI00224C007E|nr:uncharacterized protein LOC127783260 [Oryza glaberrima]